MLMRERVDVLPDLFNKARYFFEKPAEYVEKVVRKKWNDQTKVVFSSFVELMGSHQNLKDTEIQELFNSALEQNDAKAGAVMQILRVAISGQTGGPDLMRIMEIIGSQETKQRIEYAIESFNKTAVKSE